MNRFMRLSLCALTMVLLASPVLADPPDRVGRISLLSGDVEFRNADGGDDEDAVPNWPITSGNVLATGRLARAEVRVGSTAVRLEEATELEFVRLDDQRIKLRLTKGIAAVRVKNAERAADFELITSQGRLLLLEPGRYRFESNVTEDTTSVAAFQGSARFEGPNAVMTVNSGQRLEVYGLDSQRLQTSAALPDDFDDWSLARDRRDQSARTLQFVSNEMTGYEDLDDYGDWGDSAEYGALWYPRALPTGWAPYRWGRWAWVEPWGWTWVDDMPWGFAPFHYGRWALVGGAWAWVPGRAAVRPVYAPALVAWVGRPGWNVSLNLGAVSAVGWFPLAPREVYYPAYPCSTGYVRKVNVAHVASVTQITDTRRADATRASYRYRSTPQAVTVVAADAVAQGRPVRREVVAVNDGRSLAALPVVATAPAVTPVQRRFRGNVAAPVARERAVADDRGKVDPRHPLRQETREQPMPKSELRRAMPGDHSNVTEQARPLESSRKAADLPRDDRRTHEALPAAARELPARGMRRDDARSAESPPVGTPPAPRVDGETDRRPRRDDSQVRQIAPRPRPQVLPSAPVQHPQVAPAAPPRPSVSAPNSQQRGIDAAPAAERGRRHDRQGGMSGMGGMGGMGGKEAAPAENAGKRGESRGKRAQPVPGSGGPNM